MAEIPFYMHEQIADRTYRIRNAFTAGFDINAYLVEGQDYALLIDTIMGFGDLNAYCKKITDKPVKVVNTHAHWDHVGCNFFFDSCYMPVRDIGIFQGYIGFPKEQIFELAKNSAKEEYKDLLELDGSFAGTHPVKIYPVSDGDIFDLGDRKLEVLDCGGHTPGHIVLIDDLTRICFAGDVCNGNTLLEFDDCLPVSVYRENLKRLKTYASRFDMMYGGHEIFDSSIIDEGIETATKVIEGTDDKAASKGLTGKDICYAYKKSDDGTNEGGMRFNMSYDPANITGGDRTHQIIKA